MAEPRLARLTRLLGIVTHLEEHGETSFEDLGALFGVEAATIRADIDTLWAAGRPGLAYGDVLEFDINAFDDGYAALIDGQGVRQVRVSPREAVALVGALSTIVASGAAPDAATSVLAQVRAQLEGVHALEVVAAAPVDAGVARILREGIERGLAVSVDYVDARDRASTRVIEPYRLVTIDGIGYVECFCQRARDRRTLRIARIASASLTSEQVEGASADSQGFTLAPLYPTPAVVVAERQARWVFEDIRGVSIDVLGEGSQVRATFDVADEEWLVRRLLLVAPLLESITPVELHDAFTTAAASLVREPPTN